jgi:hypothetical protein
MAEDFSKRRIFKYELAVKPKQVIMMPKGAVILSFSRQGPLPFVWASVDENQPREPRAFRLVTTGEVFNEERCVFVGHTQLGGGPEPWYEAFLFEIEAAVKAQNPDLVEERFQPDMAEASREIKEQVAYEDKAPLKDPTKIPVAA